MKVVYEAANNIEAYLLKSRLEHDQILSWITGEYLQGGIGEIQTHGLARIMVSDADVKRARRVIKEYESEVYSTVKPIEFIGVGVTKGGSSWLADMLAAHPDICLSEPKEVRYFNPTAAPGVSEPNPNRNEGQGWYHKRFSHCSDAAVRGEYTPMYMADPQTIDNIHCYNPKAKLIVSLRNPVDRLISHYRMNRDYIGSAKLPIDQEIESDARYLQQGRYGEQLEYLYSKFDREQVLVLFMEDIHADRAGTVASMYRFLGVNAAFRPAALDKKSNEAKQARFAWAGSFIHKLPRLFVALRLNSLLVGMRKLNLHKAVLGLLTKESSKLELPDGFREKLQDYYREDISKLEQLTGRDLPGWLG